MQRSVRVLLRLDHPDDEVGERHDPVDLEPVRGLDGVEVGKVQEQQAARAPVVTWWRRPISSQSRSESPPSPQTAAWPSDVVGRRRPTVARSVPERVLNSRDLPTPVGPASATTVVSMSRPSRAPAFSVTASSLSTAPGSSRPSATCTASASAVSLRSKSRLTRRVGPRRSQRAAERSPRPRLPRPRPGVEASGVSPKELVSAVDEVPAGLGGELADRLVAEDRLEDFLTQRRCATRDHHLDARDASGRCEDAEHHRETGAVDAERCKSRRRPLGLALAADELHDEALPGAHLLLGVASQTLRCSIEPGRCLEERVAGYTLAPRACDPLGSPLGGRPNDGLEPVLHRDPQLLVGARLAGDDALQAVTSRSDARLERPHDVAGSDHLVPAREHFASKQRATPQGVLDLATRGRVRQVDVGPKLCGGGELVGDGALDCPCAGGEARQRAGQRPSDQLRSGLRVGSQAVQPAPNGRERLARDQLVLERHLRDDEQVGVEALLAHHLAHVARHLALGVSGNAVEHDGHRRPAVSRRAQELPRDGVGVAEGGSYEQPAVGGREQLVRERAVLREHRVDVGRVEEREAGRKRRVGDELKGAGRRRGAGLRASCGRIRSSWNQRRSSGWQTRTGARVVGRSTPAGLTSEPTRLFTSVDFPAPVEPPTTMSTGASIWRRRGRR